jgi:predicted amidophosphoribosyltransferase
MNRCQRCDKPLAKGRFCPRCWRRMQPIPIFRSGTIQEQLAQIRTPVTGVPVAGAWPR